MGYYVLDFWLLVEHSTQLGQTVVGWDYQTAELSCSWLVRWPLVFYCMVVLFMRVWAMFALHFMRTLHCLSL
jgi:hypothetical protein